jgi:hypothetical protein
VNWQTFKALHEIYEAGRTKCRTALIHDPVFLYYINQTRELLQSKTEITISPSKPTARYSFGQAFEKIYKPKYVECLAFLELMGLNTPYCRFEVEDILILSQIKRQMDSGELKDIREQIVDSEETRRGVSLMFFKNEKYLDGKNALESAVKLVLKIEKFADDRDFQYLYVLHCSCPRAIVLCENLNFLKKPGAPRENQLELWYAGGKNVEKLQYADRRGLPIYYSCDWDYDGLDIFRLVRDKIPEIVLLLPNGTPKDIETSLHKSLWRNREMPDALSGLDRTLFSTIHKNLIQQLIGMNRWIIEESNDLIKMVSQNSNDRN